MARGRPEHPERDDHIGGLSDDELAGLTLDDAFVRAAAVKEPPAAERDTAGPIAAPPRPPRLRLSPPRRTRAPLAWVRRRAATIVIGLLILAMLAGSVGPFASRRPRPEPTGSPDAPAGEGGSPFAGTPAAQFADGTAGLVIPAASAVGDLRTADVALALVSVRHATAAANLESSVLRAGSIAPYRHVVGPATQARLDGHEGNLGDFVTRFPGQGVELATTAPKVSGTFTYRVDGTAAVLVEGRHLFAYATAAPGAAGNIEIVAVRRDTVWRVERTVDGMAKPELLTSAVASSGHCLAEGADGFVWPRFTTPDLAVRAGSAVPVQWDVAEPLVASVDCFLPVGSPV